QPDDDVKSGVTKVVHSFTKEWVKDGHRVLVIHNHTSYPKIYSKIVNKTIGKINSKFGVVFTHENQYHYLMTEKEVVLIHRLQMKKYIPKTSFSEIKIVSQFNKIIDLLNEINFTPDLVVGHWENPQILLVSKLKDYFHTKSAFIFHEIVYSNNDSYKNKISKHINNIDVIGARSSKIAEEVKNIFDYKKDIFICKSGIPDIYFNKQLFPVREFDEKKNDSFIFVGRLVKRKNVDLIIKAFKKYESISDFTFRIVGVGEEKNSLMQLAKTLKLDKSIYFDGFLERNQILEK